MFCYFKIEEYFKDLIVDNEFEYLYVKFYIMKFWWKIIMLMNNEFYRIKLNVINLKGVGDEWFWFVKNVIVYIWKVFILSDWFCD